MIILLQSLSHVLIILVELFSPSLTDEAISTFKLPWVPEVELTRLHTVLGEFIGGLFQRPPPPLGYPSALAESYSLAEFSIMFFLASLAIQVSLLSHQL
jgi:hypothetical protein